MLPLALACNQAVGVEDVYVAGWVGPSQADIPGQAPWRACREKLPGLEDCLLVLPEVVFAAIIS